MHSCSSSLPTNPKEPVSQHMLNTIPAGIALYEYGPNGVRILYFNDSLCELVGYSREEYQELSERDPLCLIHKDDVPKVMRVIQSYIINDIPVSIVYRIHARQGLRWLSLHTRVAERPNADAMTICAVFTDVTERKAEQILAERQRHYQQIIDVHLPNGTILNQTNITKPPLYISDSFCKLLGYERKELYEMYKTAYRDIIHPGDFERVKELNQRYEREAPGEFQMEFRFVRKDGSVIWVLEHAKRIAETDGEAGYLCVFANNTQHRLTDESIRLKEEEYRLVVKKSGKIVFRYDIPTHTIYAPTDAGKDTWFMYCEFDVPFATLQAGYVALESVDDYIGFYDAMRRGDPEGSVELCRKAHNGQYRWYRGEFTTLFGDDDRPVTAVISYEDVTESREENQRNVMDRELLGRAVATVYPMTISVNLTKNTYHMIEYKAYTTKKAEEEGVFDELIDVGLSTLPKEDREPFARAFSRQNQLDAYARGERRIQLRHRQWGDDGVLRWMETTVIFVDNPFDSDIVQLTMAQVIDDRMESESALRAALAAASRELGQKRYALSLIMDNLPACVLLYPAGKEAGTRPPAYVGGKLYERLGYTEEAFRAFMNDYNGLVCPEDRGRAHEHALRATSSLENAFEMSFRVMRRDGSLARVREVSSLTRDAEGKPLYVSVVTDISGEA